MPEQDRNMEISASRSSQAHALTSPAYADMIEAVRGFLDNVVSANPDEEMSVGLAEMLNSWSEKLASVAVGETERACGRMLDLPGRGYIMLPCYMILGQDAQELHGTVEFGKYFLGGNGAAHGGAVPLLFDEIFGRLINSAGRPKSRTAYLHTDFRSITRIDVELTFRVWLVSEEGRKRVVRGEIRHGETLCAEGEALFLALKPGQP